jgi:hypothetical protein
MQIFMNHEGLVTIKAESNVEAYALNTWAEELKSAEVQEVDSLVSILFDEKSEPAGLS